MLRSLFHQQLDEVANHIQELGSATLAQLDLAIASFANQDAASVAAIIDNDKNINKNELDLNERVFDIIARQQPVASDLRKLIVVMKIAGDLERVADLAVDLAKVSKRLVPYQGEARQELSLLATDARNMVAKALIAYKNQDVMAAQQLAKLDDEIDERFGLFIKHLFRQDVGEPDVEMITQLAFIARYVERIADYATNLSEWIIYEANGQHFDLN
ncbi:phosphate transport system regulatory protein PhoU [Bacillus sp. JCM 19046]|uniref:Phosphate-specific transport system accessory protein PhoU n=1 Tax=Shouchella xiaoxiensis TaxID=766895 RepID=A0ABS2SSX6_9BACI|nr:phosphate signaling complex protein PhoU [Shouchella xiaoxiensis]MBM7838607.1 phosphate transport system protein [Shouchella xiaoxiensis]GAF13339.1 phosphate transport system regulatory protein PhoU [Bacillus sp. JCM 19045]GAF19717.1 phosphate transport system regulatory protein PhoU [Bacillus sp. JCM 19046]